jgi:hypothetical protein
VKKNIFLREEGIVYTSGKDGSFGVCMYVFGFWEKNNKIIK